MSRGLRFAFSGSSLVSTWWDGAATCSRGLLRALHRDSMARFGFSSSPRVYGAAGAGACLITDAFDGVAQLLEPGREVRWRRRWADASRAAHRRRPGLKPGAAGRIDGSA
ncbi:hypothetical protein EJ065_1626 [Corallococcus coralloides]|uniref:Spore protein YkvP/CgeB glycosyl transferase-like domain-containing protein n=1 Tax=Corallococcus coralloides TaxID=184914 RepID=A0A410RMZ4_CORCK|nr:glycosyltransferase [Corallococcus coralloides]QAT83225.1 hypothetical protein EJ065_1626 [Corallococcus coralloides]